LVVELPWQSVTVTVTEVIPGPIGVPHGGDWVTIGTDSGQAQSVTVTGTQGTVQLVTVIFVGQVTTGPVFDSPKTVTMHWLELPQRSVTVTVTVADGPGTIVPAGGDCEYTNRLAGVQLSVAMMRIEGMTSRQLEFNGTTTVLVGQWITGGVVSTTVTTWLQVLLSPQASVISHVLVMNFGHTPLVTVLIEVISTLVVVPLKLLVQQDVAVG
jgi:hypothetical protein